VIFLIPKNRILPDNWEEELSKYIVQDHKNVIIEYNKIFDQQSKQVWSDVQENFEKNKLGFDSHSQVIERILKPFYDHNVEFACDFLFVDPLYYDNEQGIIQNLCIFDLLFANLIDDTITTIILVEVKGRYPNVQINIEDLERYEKEIKIRKLIVDKIQKYLVKNNKPIKISKKVRFEYVLAVNGFYRSEAIKKIENKKLPMIIWPVINDFTDNNRYRIELIDGKNMPNKSGIRTYHSSNDIKNLFKKDYKYHPIVKFIPSSDIHFIIHYTYNLYIKLYGKEITKENLKEFILTDGLGNNYDDEQIVDVLIDKIIKKSLKIGVIKEESGSFFWKKINIKEKILEDNFNNNLRKKTSDFLQIAIKNSTPRRKTTDIRKFLKKNSK